MLNSPGRNLSYSLYALSEHKTHTMRSPAFTAELWYPQVPNNFSVGGGWCVKCSETCVAKVAARACLLKCHRHWDLSGYSIGGTQTALVFERLARGPRIVEERNKRKWGDSRLFGSPFLSCDKSALLVSS